MILPISADDPASRANTVAWGALGNWDRPVLTIYSKQFAATAMGPERVLRHIPGCTGQPHALLDAAGFYIPGQKFKDLPKGEIRVANAAVGVAIPTGVKHIRKFTTGVPGKGFY